MATAAKTGESRMIIPLGSLISFRKEKGAGGRFAWLNHTLFSPDGKKFIFLNRWHDEQSGRLTRMFVSGLGGSNVCDLMDSYRISHFDWKNEREIFVWAEIGGKKGFWLIEADTGRSRFAYESMQTEDGHGSWSKDGKMILLDTYPLEDHRRRLRIFNAENLESCELGSFYSPPEITGPFRCDLHPRWSFSEKHISFDSVHEGCRRVYAGQAPA